MIKVQLRRINVLALGLLALVSVVHQLTRAKKFPTLGKIL